MNKGEHYYKWSSRMQQGLEEYFSQTIDKKNFGIFCMLWHSYRLNSLTKSAYFELFRVGDGWHTLNVQKCVDGVLLVKFIVRENYANALERFVK